MIFHVRCDILQLLEINVRINITKILCVEVLCFVLLPLLPLLLDDEYRLPKFLNWFNPLDGEQLVDCDDDWVWRFYMSLNWCVYFSVIKAIVKNPAASFKYKYGYQFN